MKIIGVHTEDFALYYELVKVLKERNIPFVSLADGDPVPLNVGVILTSPWEANDIDFPSVLAVENIEVAIHAAEGLLKGKERYAELVVGVDPGKMPGIAVVGDGLVLETEQPASPDGVRDIVKRVLATYASDDFVVKIGHGDPTRRNRIINSLAGLRVRVEIVDEHGTTKHVENDDIRAAISIARGKGLTARHQYIIEPTDGELRDIQRRSRKLSGNVTISKELAKKVALGEMTLEEAVEKQSG